MTGFTDLSDTVLIISDSSLWGMVIKSSIAITLAAVVCSLLKRQSAAVRHRIQVFGLAGALVVPLASQLLPQFMLYALPGVAGASALWEDESSSPVTNSAAPLRDPTGTNAANSAVPRSEQALAASTPSASGIRQTVPSLIRSVFRRACRSLLRSHPTNDISSRSSTTMTT